MHYPEVPSLTPSFLIVSTPTTVLLFFSQITQDDAIINKLETNTRDKLNEFIPALGPALYLCNQHFSLLLQSPCCLPQKLEIICAHQREAEDA